ncbi:MAG: purine-nucleoside phosphorylase [Candidatus Riflebacteria bacterium]|nr:purine-nucleoside phosphorylase [Candidatus Riflebacteria bacterium]
MDLYDRIQQTAGFLRDRIGPQPQVAVILGSGLGPMADGLTHPVRVDYVDVPHFPVSTVQGHHGRLIAGNLGAKRVLAMQGRFHPFEGDSLEKTTFPVRVFRALEIPVMIVTNAAGGINRWFHTGDVMVIRDVINHSFLSPLRGLSDERLGPRFPDLSRPVSERLVALTTECAAEMGMPLQHGTYAAVTGPNYETPAELRMFSRLGVDAIGMSTVAELIVARQCGIPELLGLSVITDMATGEPYVKVTHDEVIIAAREAEPRFVKLVSEVIRRL